MISRAGDDVGGRAPRCRRSSRSGPFVNIPSIRRVTAKPPTMLMLASRIATNASTETTRVVLPELQQRPDHHDPGDRVRHRHQRGVQGVVDLPDDVVADHDGQHEHREVVDSSVGAKAVTGTAAAAPAATSAYRRAGGGRLPAARGPSPPPARPAAGAADTEIGGGGQSISPWWMTVIARCTTSSRSSTSRAVLPRDEQLEQVDQVRAVELRGLRGQPARRSV